MATGILPPAAPPVETMADLLERLGGISPQRVRMSPPPGTGTEKDVIEIEAKENRLFELVDGVLVEKPPGYRESLLAAWIATALNNFVMPRRLGLVSGPDGMMRLFPGLLRMPDVAFVSRQRLPGGKVPTEAAPLMAPDLAIEVLSESNTKGEMALKRREYFSAGVRLVWLIDHRNRTATVFTDVDTSEVLDETQFLDGTPVLPGFKLGLRELFASLDS